MTTNHHAPMAPNWTFGQSDEDGNLMYSTILHNSLFGNAVKLIIVIPKDTNEELCKKVFEATSYESLTKTLQLIQEDTPEIKDAVPNVLAEFNGENDEERAGYWCYIKTPDNLKVGVGIFMVLHGKGNDLLELAKNIYDKVQKNKETKSEYYTVIPDNIFEASSYYFF